MGTVGELLHGYELVRKLGQGGYGEVFLARDPKNERLVAVKALLPIYCLDPQFRRRLRNEATALKTLKHPQIVQLYDVLESENSISLVMEYIEGDSLRERLTKGALGTAEVIELVVQIGSALDAAHSATIVHRDIKPENIICNPQRGAILLDFGMSRFMEGVTATRPGQLVGTWKYIAPEVFRGERADASSDLFSLAIVAYECLVGYRPFDGEHEAAIMYAILNDPPKEMGPSTDPIRARLWRVIAKSLQKDRRSRHANAAEFASELKCVAVEEDYQALGTIVPTLAIFDVIKLAVLFFRNIGSPDNEYAAFGLSDDLIAKLSQNPRLELKPVRTAMSNDLREDTLRQSAVELGVDLLMAGACSEAGGVLEISVTVTDAHARLPSWTRHWRGSLIELTSLSTNIASDLVNYLGIKQAEDVQSTGCSARPLPDPVAYEYFLRGRYLFEHKQSAADIEVAAGLFKRALAIDSEFVEASLGAARIHSFQGNSLLAVDELQRARSLVDRSPDTGIQIEIELALSECYLRSSDWSKAYDCASEARRLALELSEVGQEARALTILIDILEPQARYDEAMLFYRRVVWINQQLRRKDKIAAAIKSMGVIHQRRGRFSSALACYDEALELCRSQELSDLEAKILNNVGLINLQMGRLDQARARFEKALSIHQQLGDLTSIAVNLNNLGVILHTSGSFREALAYFREAAGSAAEVGDLKNRSLAIENEAKALAVLGDYARASTKNREAQELAQRLEYQLVLVTTERNFGDIALYQSRPTDALVHYERAEKLARDSDIRGELVNSLLALTRLYQQAGDWRNCLNTAERTLQLVWALRLHSQVKIAVAYRVFVNFASTRDLRALRKLTALADTIDERTDCQQFVAIYRLVGQAHSMFPKGSVQATVASTFLNKALERATRFKVNHEQTWLRALISLV